MRSLIKPLIRSNFKLTIKSISIGGWYNKTTGLVACSHGLIECNEELITCL